MKTLIEWIVSALNKLNGLNHSTEYTVELNWNGANISSAYVRCTYVRHKHIIVQVHPSTAPCCAYCIDQFKKLEMNAFPFSICFLVPDFTIFSFVRNLCMPHVQRTGSKFPATEVKFVVVVDLRFSHFFFYTIRCEWCLWWPLAGTYFQPRSRYFTFI